MSQSRLHDLFVTAAENRPGVEVQFREGARWSAVSLGELRSRVDRLAAALVGYGLGPGKRIAVVTESGLEGWTGELAALACGATSVPLDPRVSDEDLFRSMKDSAAAVALVSTPGVLARVLTIRPDLDELDLVLVFEAGGSEGAVAATEVDTVCGWGADRLRDEPDLLSQARTSGKPGIPAVAVHGPRVPVLLSSEGILEAAHGLSRAVSFGAEDTVIVGLPWFEPACRPWCWAAVAAGAGLAFSEGFGVTLEDCRTVRPTICVTRGENLSDLREPILEASGGRGWFGRRLAERALAVGRACAEGPLADRRVGYDRGWKLRVANLAFLRRPRNATGRALRYFVAVDGAVVPSVADFFLAAGLPVLEGSGPAEASGALAVNSPSAFHPGSVGRPVSGLEVRVGDNDEIEIRGRAATGQVIDDTSEGQEGPWRKTNLRGRLDDRGFLVLI